jgi:serine/threonine-protein kinase RsbW
MTGTTNATIGDVTADVELRLPADGAYASVLRTLTAGLAARLDFTMDDIEDLRIAVSEAVSMVLDQADAGADLVGRFRLEPARLTVEITAASEAPTEPDYDGFGWQVLTTLASEARVAAAPGDYTVTLVVRSSIDAAPAS